MFLFKMKLIVLILILLIGANLYSNAEAAGTSLCYNCYSLGACENPSIQQCPDSDENFACVAVKIPRLGPSVFIQTCTLPDNPEINQLCDAIELMEDGSCEFCYTDLCNVFSNL